MRYAKACLLAIGAMLAFSGCNSSSKNTVRQPSVEIMVLSSAPERVSGGDARLAITGEASLLQDVELWLNGAAIDMPNFVSSGDRLEGVVDGLIVGKNQLEVHHAKHGKLDEIMLVNHPAHGPVISGPHQTPFFCHPEKSGLGPVHDEYCHTEAIIEYYYKPADGGGTVGAGFLPLPDIDALPAGIARTTTSEGVEVDFIVRIERGTINRGVYQIAVLYDPSAPEWSVTAPQPQWNGRLYYAMEGSCRPGYVQGSETANDILRDRHGQDEALGLGFAIARHSLNRQGNMCGNDQINAESMMMTKEHFIVNYGVPSWTIGSGGSGGAIQQFAIGDNYPGLLDGIIATQSFPDVWSIASGALDSGLLSNYFDKIRPGEWTDPNQRAVVSGFGDWTLGVIWTVGNVRNLDPRIYCDDLVPADQIYHPEDNPTGVRCTITDSAVNIFGKDERGFARRPLDNIGVQYGLNALNAGLITADQFIDLNRHIGGFDIDGNLIEERMQADPDALRIAYASGRVVNGGLGLATIPIIDAGQYNDFHGDYHDRFRGFSMRERLKRENGHADNQVILTVPPTMVPPALAPANLLDQMDRWLAAIAADKRDAPLEEKVAAARPSDLSDACWDEDGTRHAGPADHLSENICNELYRPYGDPRTAAGAPLTNDVMKCALKPVDAADYDVSLSSAQIAELKEIFPEGVCDYSKPGISQAAPIGTWLSWDSTH